MADSRPNIILIMTDQQRYDTIAALGYPHMDTPNLDRLVREGTAFERCYVNAPTCVPSRAALFTGYSPHTTGVLRNGDRWTHTWVELLAAAGYHCANIGKMHLQPFDAPAGFHQRYVLENKERRRKEVGRYYFDEWDRALATHGYDQRPDYRVWPDYKERLGAYEWPLPAPLHSDNFTGDLARWWLRSYEKTEPLFLTISFPGPHPPYDPTAEDGAAYMSKDLPIAPVEESDLAGQPPPIVNLREQHIAREADSVFHQANPPMAARHRQRAYYFGNVTMIDRKIGEILEELKGLGYLDNAIVIFTSDHGDCLGDHGQSQKWNGYEQSVRVPLIVWSPGRVAAGRKVEALVQLFDIGPTILDYAGVAVPESFEAETLRPALEGKPFAGRPFVCSEQGRDNFQTTVDLSTMLRTRDWKLVHFSGETCGQLFNLADDPAEVRNLWDDPAAAGKKRELMEQLAGWRIDSGYRARAWAAAAR